MEEDKPKFYGPLAAVLWTIFIFFVSQILAVVIISRLPEFRHISGEELQRTLENNSWAGFQFVALVEAFTLLGIYTLLRARKVNPKRIGLNRPQLKYIGYALGAFVVYFGVYIISLTIITQLVPSLNLEQKQELGFDTTTQGSALWPVFFSLVILPPIAEEIVARGFLFSGLRSKLPFVATAIITSIIFAFPHLLESNSGLLWVAGIDTFVLSIVLCYLREKTDSLWPSIGVHMLKNGLAFAILFNIFSNFR